MNLQHPEACPAPVAGIGLAASEALARRTELLAAMVVALVAEEVGHLRGRSVEPAEWLHWRPETRLDEDGVGLDSLARLEVIARVEAAFGLGRTGSEDYLVIRPTLGDWVEVVAASLLADGPGPARFAFRTSGSTGAPRRVVHDLAHLAAEATGHPRIAQGLRVATLVAPHHLFGFQWSVLSPALAGTPVVDLRGHGPREAAGRLAPRDLLIATPFLLDLMLRAGRAVSQGVTAIVSGAAASPELWSLATSHGLRMIEIYGATETAAVGYRTEAGGPFRLMPHLVGQDPERLAWPDGSPVAPSPDRLEPAGHRCFHLGERLDGAVAVAGVTVHPARIASVIEEHADVASASVRLSGSGPGARLKAFVVPAPGTPSQERLEASLRAFAASRLLPAERPCRYRIGSALPVNRMGKPADWD